MARRSKTAKEQPPIGTADNIPAVWKAGIYARLSADSNSRKNESIDTQIAIAKAFMGQAGGMTLTGIYTDLGKTGTDFNREGFCRLMEDIRQKKVNCVIVKDFSRFGRNYIETGNYIEKIFPFLKVRFIAVTDGYDSERMTGDSGMQPMQSMLSMNLKNIVNELYARDIAQRVRSAKKVRQEMGSYTGGVPPYGYRVEKIGERRILLPEKITKDIVAWIFKMYAGGSSYKEIAQGLYHKRVQRPKVYRMTGEVCCKEGMDVQQWPYDTIRWILANPVYIGTLVQARACGHTYQEQGGRLDMAVAESTHEPLVPKDIFFQVSRRLEEQGKYANRRGFSKKFPPKEDIFQGMLYCGECGHRLTRNSAVKTFSNGNKVRSYFYSCPNRRKIDAASCPNKGISQKALETIIQAVLEKEFSLAGVNREGCLAGQGEPRAREGGAKEGEATYLREKEGLALTGSRLYREYREGKISRETYLKEKKKQEERLEAQRKQEEASAGQGLLQEQGAAGKEEDTPDGRLIKCLIKRILVGQGKQAEIVFNFRGNLPIAHL